MLTKYKCVITSIDTGAQPWVVSELFVAEWAGEHCAGGAGAAGGDADWNTHRFF